MPIATLCKGDSVVVQAATTTRGASGGQSRAFADGATLDCLVQTPGAAEVRDYAARGMRLTHWVFFSADPGLTTNDRLKWVTRRNVALSTPIYLRALDCYPEGRPGSAGSDMLWVADCEQVTSRGET